MPKLVTVSDGNPTNHPLRLRYTKGRRISKRRTKSPSVRIRCGCCSQSVVIYTTPDPSRDPLSDSLEIGGVNGSVAQWRQVLCPLLGVPIPGSESTEPLLRTRFTDTDWELMLDHCDPKSPVQKDLVRGLRVRNNEATDVRILFALDDGTALGQAWDAFHNAQRSINWTFRHDCLPYRLTAIRKQKGKKEPIRAFLTKVSTRAI